MKNTLAYAPMIKLNRYKRNYRLFTERKSSWKSTKNISLCLWNYDSMMLFKTLFLDICMKILPTLISVCYIVSRVLVLSACKFERIIFKIIKRLAIVTNKNFCLKLEFSQHFSKSHRS